MSGIVIGNALSRFWRWLTSDPSQGRGVPHPPLDSETRNARTERNARAIASLLRSTNLETER